MVLLPLSKLYFYSFHRDPAILIINIPQSSSLQSLSVCRFFFSFCLAIIYWNYFCYNRCWVKTAALWSELVHSWKMFLVHSWKMFLVIRRHFSLWRLKNKWGDRRAMCTLWITLSFCQVKCGTEFIIKIYFLIPSLTQRTYPAESQDSIQLYWLAFLYLHIFPSSCASFQVCVYPCVCTSHHNSTCLLKK